jgi:hypothetical protein
MNTDTALVQWFSKQQATIETSVFGAEFVAMQIGIESLRGLRYKLRMMGDIRSLLHLRQQHVGSPQHSEARVNAEKEK